MLRRGFRSRGESLELRLEDTERVVMRDLLDQLLRWIEPDARSEQEDPLARIVGIAAEARRPEDPALLRLFPDAYADDEASSSDFRRFTEQGLRQQRADRTRAALGCLDRADAKGRIAMTPDEARAWLLALNDLRLVLGTRLGVTEDDERGDAADRPVVYDWLTWLQSTLVEALMP